MNRVRKFASLILHPKVPAVLSFLIVLAAIPLTVMVAQQTQNTKQEAFGVCEQRYAQYCDKFRGCNFAPLKETENCAVIVSQYYTCLGTPADKVAETVQDVCFGEVKSTGSTPIDMVLSCSGRQDAPVRIAVTSQSENVRHLKVYVDNREIYAQPNWGGTAVFMGNSGTYKAVATDVGTFESGGVYREISGTSEVSKSLDCGVTVQPTAIPDTARNKIASCGSWVTPPASAGVMPDDIRTEAGQKVKEIWTYGQDSVYTYYHHYALGGIHTFEMNPAVPGRGNENTMTANEKAKLLALNPPALPAGQGFRGVLYAVCQTEEEQKTTTTNPTPTVCTQTITYAINPANGACVEYSTSCISEGFTKVDNCTSKKPAETTGTPVTNLVGDVNRDKSLSILDYHILNSCAGFNDSDKTTCGNYKKNADLNGDGKIDGVDYNIFLRELKAYEGE